MPFLQWVHDLPFVLWVRESESLLGYTLYLAGHTIGLVFLVGPNLVIAARVLGLAPELPLAPLARFRPVIAAGLILTVLTGLVLFATAPVGYVHNVVFLVKMAAIAVALACLAGMVHGLFGPGRTPDALPVPRRIVWLTAGSLVFWAIAVVAGRLTAYSGVVVLSSVGAFLVVVVAVAAGAFAMRVLRARRPPAPHLILNAHPRLVNGGK